VDTVLGVSMAPEAVRMVLVEGQNADGATVDEDSFEVVDGQSPPNVRGPDQVISAILGTQEGAAANGHQLLSTGVTWTDPIEAAALHDALADRKMENVMLVSAFLAAAALAQEVGNATGYGQTALLFVEPDTATLAVVDTADGSVAEVRRQPLQNADPTVELAQLVSGVDSLQMRPDGLFVVGSGVNIAPIKAALEAATALPVSVPEEPETALARGAALASANAPLFSSSTAAMAYAQDPGTGAVDPFALAAHYVDAPADAGGDEALAYSAVADDTGNAYTAVAPQDDVAAAAYPEFGASEGKSERRRLWLVASTVAAIFIVGVVALVIALALHIRPNVGTRPDPGHHVIAPTNPAPAPNAPPAAPAPAAPAPAPAPAAPAPAPAAPAPAPAAPAPAPAPAPVAPAPAAPPVVPVPVPGGGGPGFPGGGGPGFPGGGGPGPGGPGPGGPGGGIPGIPGGGGPGGGGPGPGGFGGGGPGIPGIPGGGPGGGGPGPRGPGGGGPGIPGIPGGGGPGGGIPGIPGIPGL
jgi:hypothetical protein